MDKTSRKVNNEAWLICPNWTEVRRFIKNNNNKENKFEKYKGVTKEGINNKN